MEITVRPSKEMNIFYNIIYSYLENIIPGEVPKVIFKKNTPKNIIDKFNEIKYKIGYELNT